MGIDPRPWSVRELFWMLDGNNDRTGEALRSLIAAIYNTVLEKPITADDLKSEPREEKEMTVDQVYSMGVLLGVCVYE